VTVRRKLFDNYKVQHLLLGYRFSISRAKRRFVRLFENEKRRTTFRVTRRSELVGGGRSRWKFLLMQGCLSGVSLDFS